MSVLKGSLPFMADLMRAIDDPGPDRPDGGLLVRRHDDRNVRAGAHPQGPVVDHRRQGRADRRGHHRHRADAQLPAALPARQEPASLRICALLDKPARRLVEIQIDYLGFTIPDEFVVGYGLDFGEYYRNLPFIGVLKPEVYSEVSGEVDADDDASTSARPRAHDGRARPAVLIVDRLRSCRGGRSGAAPGITAQSGNGLAGSGILVFLVGIATLALVALPDASGDRPAGSSTAGSTFAILAVAGYLDRRRVVELLLAGAFQFGETAQVVTNGPGVWISVIG